MFDEFCTLFGCYLLLKVLKRETIGLLYRSRGIVLPLPPPVCDSQIYN